MSPQEKRQLKEATEFIASLKTYSRIPFDVENAFKRRFDKYYAIPDGLELAPLAAVTAPTGGVTVDSQARTAINTIITRLEDLGFVLPN